MIFADSTGVELSGNKFLTASILFKSLLKKEIKGQNIGLLLPSTAVGAFINYTVLLMGKTIVNLNYTSEISALKSAIDTAEIKTVIASRRFIERLENKGINIREILDLVEVIYLEDAKKDI